jgi:hypothetical protein
MDKKKVKKAGKKRRYTVYLLTPYCTWEGVEASSKKEAVGICQGSSPNELDGNEVTRFYAMEED